MNVTLPDEYRFIIERYNYEFLRRTEAISFLLSQHFDDEDGDFCYDEQISEILIEASNSLVELMDSITGVTAILIDDEAVQGKARTIIDRRFERLRAEKL